MTRGSAYKSRVLAIAVGTAMLAWPLGLPRVSAQSSATEDWEKAAGGTMSFDVVSLKQNTDAPGPGTDQANIPLDAQDSFAPTGGLFSASGYRFIGYMTFAYKLTRAEREAVVKQLPPWANNTTYAIEARAAGNPTKDQYRLMTQGLLADRFKLGMHYETRQTQVLALVQDKPGKLGPKLQPHPTGETCPTTPRAQGAVPIVSGGFPALCGAFHQLMASAQGHYTGGARNVPMSMVAESLAQFTGDAKPVIDKTGMAGDYDFLIDFSLMVNHEPLDPNAPTFLEALKDELGLKLTEQSAPVRTIVVDHIEEPSPN